MVKDWRDKIRNPNCELCSLHEEAEHVCLMGDGPLDTNIMVVGEAPGAREDETHRAFVGPAGKLLDEALQKAGIARSTVYITNAAKCRPPDNRTPTRGEVKLCSRTYLDSEIEEVRPDFILTVGNAALQAVAGKSGITKHRGHAYTVDGITVFPTYHPAAVLRNPKYGPEFYADFERFGRMVRGDETTLHTRVKLIRTTKHLNLLIKLLATAEVISYDIETTGLWEWEEGAAIVSIGFTVRPGVSYVVPIHQAYTPWRDPDAVLRRLKPVLERRDAKYVAHNGKFDCRWLASSGIFVPQRFDTMLAAHMLDENRSKGLKNLSQILLGADAYDVGDEIKDCYNMDLHRLALYNGKDTDYTLRLYEIFRQQLIEEASSLRVFLKLMMPASNALTRVESIGMWFDLEKWEKAYQVAQANRDKFAAIMLKTTKNKDLNFNSPKQVGEWLFEELGLPILEETATGAASTRESVLLRLSKRHKAVKALLLYRKWNKYITTYLDPWRENLDKHNRLHTTYQLHGTVTSRLSARGNAFHQVPRNYFIRGLFGAPPGWKFVEADYSQVELRIAAMVAREKRMLTSFLRGDDLHLKTAAETSGKRPEDISKEERKKAKAVNFGFLYGMGASKFVDYARDNYDVEVSQDEAERIRERFFEAYPALRPWHERQRRLVQRYGKVHSPIRRVRHLPDVHSGDKGIRAEAERQAINSPVQSFASDLMLLSLVRLNDSLPQREARVVGTLHDAIFFEVRDDAIDRTCRTIKQVMEDMSYVKKKFGTEVTVPIEVDIKYSQHWGDPEAIEWKGE